MRKLIIAIAAALMCVGATSAKQTARLCDLPAPAQTFIDKNFGSKSFHHATVDRDGVFGGRDYDVILTNGTELEFNDKGSLTEIDCGTKAIPSGIVPQAISDYVKRYFNNQKIVKMEVKRNRYDVRLASGVELEFDGAGKFVKVDD